MEKKYLKKYIYLFILKLLVSNKNVAWHATDEQEVLDISHWFGGGKEKGKKYGTLSSIHKAMDTSRPLPIYIKRPQKVEGDELKLVYYSLITSKKNLLLLLESLGLLRIPVLLTVYGPAVEPFYLEECTNLIKKLKRNISVIFKGEIPFSEFAAAAWQYHFFVLITKGENFGHVIFESLSLGLPVVISHFTPWQFEEGKEGFYTDLTTQSIKTVLEKLYSMDQETYEKMSQSASDFASNYYQKATATYEKEYGALFSEAIS